MKYFVKTKICYALCYDLGYVEKDFDNVEDTMNYFEDVCKQYMKPNQAYYKVDISAYTMGEKGKDYLGRLTIYPLMEKECQDNENLETQNLQTN